MKDFAWGLAIASAAWLLISIEIGLGLMDRTSRLTKAAVAHQCAHYDPQTGAFTWNTEAKP